MTAHPPRKEPPTEPIKRLVNGEWIDEKKVRHPYSYTVTHDPEFVKRFENARRTAKP
jgi:chromosome segregation and condensation protein ScpB